MYSKYDMLDLQAWPLIHPPFAKESGVFDKIKCKLKASKERRMEYVFFLFHEVNST